MFPRNFVHSAYCIMYGSRRQIMHYQFTLFDHFLYKYGTYHAMMRPKYLSSAPIWGTSICQCFLVRPLPYSVVHDRRCSPGPNEHHKYSHFKHCPVSLPSLSCPYERTYLQLFSMLCGIAFPKNRLFGLHMTYGR